MKNYIWERAFKRVEFSTQYNKYDEGIMNIVTFIRLFGGETSSVWRGFAGDLRGHKTLVSNYNLLPTIEFCVKNPPYYSYIGEPDIVEQRVAEKKLTVRSYLNWIQLDSFRESTEAEYSKNPMTREWLLWVTQNVKFFKKMEKFADQFNKNNQSYLPYKIIVWSRSNSGGWIDLSVEHSNANLSDYRVQKSLSRKKREVILKDCLVLFAEFGLFLRKEFVGE